ncbi:MAG: efflux RND transporter periplasmic adaptor subunit [Clostridia bacterium]
MRQTKPMIVLLTSALLLAACSSSAPKEAVTLQAVGKRVAVAEVKENARVRVTQLSGILKPSEETQASFETSGRIVALAAEEGDLVTQGSVIASIDNRDLALQEASAAATLQQAQAQLAQVNNGSRAEEIAQSKNLQEKAKITLEKAKADLQRSEELYRQGALSKNDLEAAQNRATIAEKDWENAKQAYSLVLNGPRNEVKQQTAGVYQQAVVGQQRAALSQAKASLSSPISGVVLEKLATVGQLTVQGTPVYRIGRVDSLLVELAVPDRDVSQWKKGDQVKVSLYDQERVGEVTRILPSVSQQSGTVPVEVLIANPNRDWLVGQVVTAKHERKGPTGIFVPVEAVLSRGEKQPYVFVARDNKAVKIPVELGSIIDNDLEIKAGLTAGDRVIIKGMDQLFDGDALEITTGEQP